MNFSSSGGALTSDDDDETTEIIDDETPSTPESPATPPEDAEPAATATPAPPEPQDTTDNAVGQDNSTVTEPASTTPPPATAPDPDPDPPAVDTPDALDEATSNTSRTDVGEPPQARQFGALDTEGSAPAGGENLFMATNTFMATSTQEMALTAQEPLAAPVDPVQALLAIPGTIINVATTVVAAMLSPFLAPGPTAPAEPPLLWAVLAWVRREVQRTFFNSTPNAVDDAVTTSEDITKTGNVLTNDTDVDDDPLTATLVTGPAHGDVVLNPDGSFTYTPDADFSGTDTFTYTVSDETGGFHLHGIFGFFSGGHSDTATVTVTVTPVNDAPVAGDDAATIDEDTQASGNVLTNDSDVDSGSLTAALGTGPANGTAVVNANGSYTYTPDANFNGTDTFTYIVSDGAATDTGTVTVTVTAVPDSPVAVDDTVATNEDNLVTFNPLANDSDGDGDTLSIMNYSQPQHGSVVFNGYNSTLTYTPDFNYFGTDTFTYTVSDGSATDTATVTVTVNPVNDIAFSGGDNYTVAEDGTLVVAAPGVLGNDTDVDADPLTAVLFSPPGHGTVDLNPDGSFTYTPDADFSGADSFEYYAYDGTTSGSLAFVNITVTPVEDPISAIEDTNTTTANTPVIGNVLTNDIAQNPDGPTESLTVTTTGSIATTGGGSVTMASDGSYTYNSATDFTGVDTFEYTVTDGLTSDVGQVSITVSPAGDNTPPVANDDELSTDANTPLTITLDDLTGNDTDAENDPLGAQIVDLPTHGTLTDDGMGNVLYTPDTDFEGTDSFTYMAFDATDDSNLATVTITVGDVVEPPTNAAPVPGWDSFATAANTPLEITPQQLLANDFDAENDTLSVTVVQPPTVGSLSPNPGGGYTYTPGEDYTGTDFFTYVATDANGESIEAVVTIAVGVPGNTAPTAVSDNLSTPANTSLTITGPVLVNDSDPDGNQLHVIVVSQPANGTVGFDGQDWVYTPDPGFIGTDSFSYTAFDGEADSIPTTVTIIVGNVMM